MLAELNQWKQPVDELRQEVQGSTNVGFGVYSWLQLVDLVSRHDTSEVYETQFFK